MVDGCYRALSGEYVRGWQVVSWVLTVAVELVGFLAGFILLNQRFGRGRAYSLPHANAAALRVKSFDGATNDQDSVQNRQDSAERDEAEPVQWNTRGIWFPHPDDPTPAEPSQTPKEDEPSSSAAPPLLEPDVYAHIRKLAELRNEGLMTPKEFEAKRRELLDRI